MATSRTVKVFRASMGLLELGLDKYDLLVLLFIADHENGEGVQALDKRRVAGEITANSELYHPFYSRASQRMIAAETGLSYSTVRECLKKLVNLRVLLKHQEPDHRAAWYASNVDALDYVSSCMPEIKKAYKTQKLIKSACEKRTKLFPADAPFKLPQDLGASPRIAAATETSRRAEQAEGPINDYPGDMLLVSTPKPRVAAIDQARSATASEAAKLARRFADHELLPPSAKLTEYVAAFEKLLALHSGVTPAEIIEVIDHAWNKDDFLGKEAHHPLAAFVKHFDKNFAAYRRSVRPSRSPTSGGQGKWLPSLSSIDTFVHRRPTSNTTQREN
jgi:hypothetical protein